MRGASGRRGEGGEWAAAPGAGETGRQKVLPMGLCHG